MVFSQAKLKRFLGHGLMLVVFLVASACGKNAPYSPYGNGYYPIAPNPSGSKPYYPYQGGGYPQSGYSGGYPYGGNYGGGGYPYAGAYPYGGVGGYPYGSPYGYPASSGAYPQYFNPQLPSGAPQAYTPFLPVDNYFRYHPSYGPTYWNNIWNNWKHTAANWGVSPYDFPKFWNSYCPQVWKSGQTQNIYVHIGQTFYTWAQPGVQIQVTTTPQQFWETYIGIIY